jgi:predicted SPOUT superfamily RNA methylase MTH1
MKTFQEFILEAYDPEVQGRSQIRTQGQGGRIGAERKKTEPEKRRMKAAGGGTTAPAKSYKDRKDIGTQRPKSTREQQPTQARGSAALSAREAQRKAAMERRAAKSGVKTKTASELLAKKAKKTVDPNYKPQKASGLTQRERLNKVKKGEKALRDLRLQATGKTKESELKHAVTQKEVSRRKKKAQV